MVPKSEIKSPAESGQFISVSGDKSFKRMSDNQKLYGLLIYLLSELECCWWREKIGDLSVKIPILRICCAVRQL